MENESVELLGYDELTAQPAVGQALAYGRVERRVLGWRHRRQQSEHRRLHVDVAGAANRRTAAFRQNLINSVGDGNSHQIHAERRGLPYYQSAYGLLVVPLVFLARLNGYAVIGFSFFFSALMVGGESAAHRVGIPQYYVLVLVSLLMIFLALVEYLDQTRRKRLAA